MTTTKPTTTQLVLWNWISREREQLGARKEKKRMMTVSVVMVALAIPTRTEWKCGLCKDLILSQSYKSEIPLCVSRVRKGGGGGVKGIFGILCRIYLRAGGGELLKDGFLESFARLELGVAELSGIKCDEVMLES